MSAGLQLFYRSGSGLRLSTNRHIDLSNWIIEYLPNEIRATPSPWDFLIKLAGAVVFFGLASFLFYLGFLFDGSVRRQAENRSLRQTSESLDQNRPRSMYEREAPTQEEVEAAFRSLLEFRTRDMTPEQKAQFNAELANKDEARKKEIDIVRQKGNAMTSIFIIAIKTSVVLLILVIALPGVACLTGVLKYHRNYLNVNASGGLLTIARPKLWGGVDVLQVPLSGVEGISCQLRRLRHGNEWIVSLSIHGEMPIQFNIEYQTRRYSMGEDPTSRIREFRQRLHQLIAKGRNSVFENKSGFELNNQSGT